MFSQYGYSSTKYSICSGVYPPTHPYPCLCNPGNLFFFLGRGKKKEKRNERTKKKRSVKEGREGKTRVFLGRGKKKERRTERKKEKEA